ncbi:hypothetical protein MTO96_023281 [Rhipicephalus appendiculatus]
MRRRMCARACDRAVGCLRSPPASNTISAFLGLRLNIKVWNASADEENTALTRKENLKRLPFNPGPTSLAAVEQNGRAVIV